MESLVASLAETFRYQQIQIMIQPKDTTQRSFRLQNSCYQNETLPNGIAPSLFYDTSHILTHFDTASIILDAWKAKDWETLYPFVSTKDYWDLALKPTYEQICRYWVTSYSLNHFSLSLPVVSHNGQQCFFPLSYQVKSFIEGPQKNIDGVLKLTKENGLWKISFSDLKILMGFSAVNEGEV